MQTQRTRLPARPLPTLFFSPVFPPGYVSCVRHCRPRAAIVRVAVDRSYCNRHRAPLGRRLIQTINTGLLIQALIQTDTFGRPEGIKGFSGVSCQNGVADLNTPALDWRK